jgi:hypothetical protein
MAFIGNTNTTQAFTPAIDYFSGNGSTTAFTLSRQVASVAQVQVTIDNVAQNPSSAYTVSSNTITFTSAPLSGTNNIYVYYTSPITQVIAPGQGTAGVVALDVYGGAGTSAMNVPSGTTAQRPSSPANGAIRYNTSTNALEAYINGVWITVKDTAYTVEYVVVAGGGGVGTRRHGGGGGAGGYRSSVVGESSGGGASAEPVITLNTGTSYTVTIGAGGTGAPNDGGNNSNTGASNGGNSVFGSITSLGGGIGSTYGTNAVSGGSGGGSGSTGSTNTAGSGTSGQGFSGGIGTQGGGSGCGGGGGGAGAVGTVGVGENGNGGNGGVGVSSSINGTATFRAGGGGGGGSSSGTAGSGGNGGGGAGANASGSPTSGTANTGGGSGGGGSDSRTTPNGGSGVVIIRYSGVQRGTGGTVTTTGGYTVHTFTSSGTYVA